MFLLGHLFTRSRSVEILSFATTIAMISTLPANTTSHFAQSSQNGQNRDGNGGSNYSDQVQA